MSKSQTIDIYPHDTWKNLPRVKIEDSTPLEEMRMWLQNERGLQVFNMGVMYSNEDLERAFQTAVMKDQTKVVLAISAVYFGHMFIFHDSNEATMFKLFFG